MVKKLSIDSVKNDLIVDIDEAIMLARDTNSRDVLHIMKKLVHNNLKEVKKGVINKSLEEYFKNIT